MASVTLFLILGRHGNILEVGGTVPLVRRELLMDVGQILLKFLNKFLGLPSFTIFVFIDSGNYDYLFLKKIIKGTPIMPAEGCKLKSFFYNSIF